MEFDDFNYKNYNEYILLEEPTVVERRRIIKERKQLALDKRANTMRQHQEEVFTEGMLEKHMEKDYTHKVLNLIDDSRVEKSRDSDSVSLDSGSKRKKESKSQSPTTTAQKDKLGLDSPNKEGLTVNSPTARSKTTGPHMYQNTTDDLSSDDNPSEHVDEDFMCRVFYNNKEIEKIKNTQENDLFDTIKQIKN